MNMMYNIIEIDDMKKIIKVISIWLKNTRAEFLRRQVLKHTKEVKREATHRLQIREFDGGLYLCIDDIPLLKEIEVREALPNALLAARRHYKEYKQSVWSDGVVTPVHEEIDENC